MLMEEGQRKYCSCVRNYMEEKGVKDDLTSDMGGKKTS